MNKHILFITVFFYLAIQCSYAVIGNKDDAINQIKIRNGDVYVLVNPNLASGVPTSSAYGLWRFYRGNDYPDDTKYKRQKMSKFPVPNNTNKYSGLTVDKFAKVYVFKEIPDAGQTSLVTLGNTHPILETGTFPGFVDTDNSKMKVGTDCASERAVKGSPPGWVYVITDDGNEGWVKYYDTTTHGSLGMVETLTEKPGVKNAIDGLGGTILPPAFKSSAANFYYTAHGGFWTGSASNPTHGIEIAGATGSPGRPAPNPTFCGNPGKANGDPRYPEWGYNKWPGSPCGSKLYPSLGAFFMTPAKSTHAADGGKGTNVAAVRVCSVSKEVRKLFFDRYIEGTDHDILKDSKPFLGLTNDDLFSGPPSGVGDGKLISGTIPVSVSVGSLTRYARFNHCGDMCGAPGQSSPPIPTTPGKAVGAMSSFGTKDSEQRKYVLKSSSSGGNPETWVMQIDGNGSTGTLGRTPLVKRDGGVFDFNGATGIDFDPETSALGSRFAASEYIGFRDTGSGIGHISTIQVSKRDDTKDWVYTSNPANPQFFRVSESFWGTGGIQWILKNPNNATIEWLQVNHETGIEISKDSMDVNNANPIVAFGVDGDGKVYWLEKSFQESLVQLTDTLGGTSPTWEKISNSGKLVAPTVTPVLTPSAGESGVPILVKISRDSGLGLFKSAIGVTTPFFIGTLPTGGVICERTFISVSGDPTKAGYWSEAAWSGQFCDTPDNTLAVDVEMAVINVANPPLSEGDFVLDIVDVPDILEGQKVTFYMENPPRFNGQKAQLAGAGSNTAFAPYNCAPDAVLRSFSESPGAFDGYVRMVSNENATGSRPVLDELKLLTEVRNTGVQTKSGTAWTYEDSDVVIGQNLPAFVYEDIPSPLISSSGPCAGGFPVKKLGVNNKTLRYRWMVKALTPPMSKKTNHPKLTELGLPNQCDNPTTDPAYVEPKLKEIPGLIFASCFEDVPLHSDPAMAALDQTEVKSPDIEFPDPGSYEVILELVGLRWDADGLTFADDSTGVSYEVTKAVASYIVNVHPMQAQLDGSVSDVHIMNNYGSYTSPDSTWDGTPLVENSVTGNAAHLEVVEGSPFPMVAEVTIDFFRAPDKEYASDSTDKTMKKYDGVGVWDYTYPGTVHDKTMVHPMNFASGPTGLPGEVGEVDQDAGNDATANYDTSPVLSQAGTVLTPIFYDPNDISLSTKLNHIQGTYSLDRYYSHGVGGATPNGLENTYESMFDWYEIKYYWFYRYKDPVSGQKTAPKLFRKGNLSEIWAIHNLASVAGKDSIMPNDIQDSSNFWNDGELIKVLDPDRRTYKVRIPLFKNQLLLDDGSPVEDRVMDWTKLGNPDFSALTPANVVAGGVNRVDANLGLYDFKVPSEPSSIEFSFYIDYPIVKWSKRNQQGHTLDADHVNETVSSDIAAEQGTTDKATLLANMDLDATYYDLVPWGPRSDALGGNNSDMNDSIRSYNSNDPRLLANSVSGWGNIGAYRTKGGLYTATEASSGGMNADGSYSKDDGTENDHWFDVIVLDNTPPSISYVNNLGDEPSMTGAFSTFSFESKVGGMWDSNDGVVISVMDNNPYQHWLNYKAFDAASPEIEPYSPYLQQFYYDLGPDPRNLLGLGAKDNGSTAQPCVWGYSISNPLSPLKAEAGNGAGWLNPFGQEENHFNTNIVTHQQPGCSYQHPFTSMAFSDQSFVRHDTGTFNLANILDSGTVKFTPPATLLSGSIYDEGVVAPVNNSYYSIQFKTKVDNVSGIPIPTEYGAEAGGEIKFIDNPGNYQAMDGSSVNISFQTTSFFAGNFDATGDTGVLTPQETFRDQAYRTAFYWVPKDALISPYFFGANSGGQETYKAYARAYDISRKHGSLAHQGLAREDVGTSLGTLDQRPNLKATEIGDYTIHDNREPNIKVTFFDYKMNSLFKFIILNDASHHHQQSQAGLFSKHSILLKSKDPRDSYYLKAGDQAQATISSGKLTVTSDYDLANPSSVTGLAAYGTDASGLGNFLVKIPEDVRFRIKAEAVDNVTLPANLNITVESDMTGFSLNTSQGALVPTEDPFEAKVTTVRDYQFQGFTSNFWQYPRPGRYDVIKITVSDEQGNTRMIRFPIEIMPQDLHFRKIGDNSRIK
ncbi:MAG: hypothetical protein KC646_01065 [Candidatus Cloacimonetes bacterium]|nr:hypothetical protein [Candidatus Cloacimonadota bacterium]